MEQVVVIALRKKIFLAPSQRSKIQFDQQGIIFNEKKVLKFSQILSVRFGVCLTEDYLPFLDPSYKATIIFPFRFQEDHFQPCSVRSGVHLKTMRGPWLTTRNRYWRCWSSCIHKHLLSWMLHWMFHWVDPTTQLSILTTLQKKARQTFFDNKPKRRRDKMTKILKFLWYLKKSATMRYLGSGVKSHKICIHEIFWFN